MQGLLAQPWNLKNEEMMTERTTMWPIQFGKTMRNQSKESTANVWRRMYLFARGKAGLASRTERYIKDKFSNLVNPKDGYLVGDCIDVWKCRVLEFLVPILYLVKPMQVTIIRGNTIFGALEEKGSIDEGIVFIDMVHKLAFGVEKSKPTPFVPTFFTYTIAKKY